MVKGSKVYLSPLQSEDMSHLYRWINDRDLVLFNAPYKPISEEKHKEWFENIQRRSDVVIFGIRLVEEDKLIGSCQLHSINHIHRNAELQIRLGDPASRGKGYGTEAVRLLVDFAFRDLNLQRVYLHVLSTNVVAIRVYEKVGFLREGMLRKAAYIDGKYVDLVLMGILRDEH